MARTYILPTAVYVAVAVFVLSPISCNDANCTTSQYLSVSVVNRRNSDGALYNELTVLNDTSSGVTNIRNETSETEVVKNGKTFLRRMLNIAYVIPPPTGTYVLVQPYGLYKRHYAQPIDKMYDVCKSEGATVAFPETFDVALIIVNQSHPEDILISVGLKKQGDGYIQIGAVGDKITLIDELWSEDGKAASGECVALHNSTAKLQHVSCDTRLPFVCKKERPEMKDVFVKGFGTYRYNYDLHIDGMDNMCNGQGGTVAYPRSLREAQAMLALTLEDDRWVSVGLKKHLTVADKYIRVDQDRTPVDIRPELWDENEPDDSGNCIVLDRRTGKLHDITCAGNFPFLCIKPLEEGDWNFKDFTANIEVPYRFVHRLEYKLQHELDTVCNVHNAFPAYPDRDPTEADVAEAIASFIPESEEYILTGLKIIRDESGKHTSHFEVVDESQYPVDKEEIEINDSWANEEPSTVGDCVVFERSTKKLKAHDCNDALPFICVFKRN